MISSFVYHGINGKILYGDSFVASAEKFIDGDTISIILSRVRVDGINYNLANFGINDKPVGSSRVVDGLQLSPGVYINSPGAMITYCDCASLKYTQGIQ